MRQLAFATAFCLTLIAIRCYISGQVLFLFLVWNLFLAWIPLLISSGLKTLKNGAFFWLIPWLLFLPNAPYIITDLFHLRPRPEVPYWFDLLILSASAITGLMLGLRSLMQVDRLFRSQLPSWFSSLMVLGICLLTGFGIYLGRFQRWNSWDLATRPVDLLGDSLSLLTQAEPLGFTLGFGLFFAMVYGIIFPFQSTSLTSPFPRHKS
ncbi:MAG: DUF1361 domain-containing protein [Bacteroidia bacterium]